MLARANKLATEPEFYNTTTNTKSKEFILKWWTPVCLIISSSWFNLYPSK
jgi:hypothetical protein